MRSYSLRICTIVYYHSHSLGIQGFLHAVVQTEQQLLKHTVISKYTQHWNLDQKIHSITAQEGEKPLYNLISSPLSCGVFIAVLFFCFFCFLLLADFIVFLTYLTISSLSYLCLSKGAKVHKNTLANDLYLYYKCLCLYGRECRCNKACSIIIWQRFSLWGQRPMLWGVQCSQ